jgi:chemotaxis protein methyltransferase CheR
MKEVGAYDASVPRFGALLARKLGLNLEDRTVALGELLRRRAVAHDLEGYLARLEAPDSGAELRRLAPDLTVGETYFFRNFAQAQAFEEVALPACIQARSAQRKLRILSAGCASGEEPYSLAIALQRRLIDLGGWTIQLKAFDVNPLMIAKAAEARYSAWSLRETPAELRDRYFRCEGRDYLLDDAVRRMVSFEERNLVEDDPLFWQEGAFDIVFCRNVLMYFTPEAARAVVARLTRSLALGGFLFLGYAETLRGLSQDFHLRHTHDTFYYQRRDDRETAPTIAPDRRSAWHDPGESSWMEVIQGASERVARLARGPSSTAPSEEPPSAHGLDRARVDRDLGPAVELLRRERFADAVALLRGLPDSSRSDPDAQILEAVLLANGGRISEAEATCRQILAANDLHAGARYVLALCREHVGDRAGAVEHNRAASYIDAGFAMPHLHLGLLARREGDTERARQELGRAAALLEREDASRILLFGGGFTREALIDLCARELRACGEGPRR